ncbi:hypothetical protein EZS27_004583 [termite gut metagenome]|uniref:Uncharacterized protein n=1 Tax=termite gut metagenome TaxID=433724 RepID=A0A5J4SRD1_9ZZZZ
MTQLTEAEIQELAKRVASIIRVGSKGVGELPVADSLTNLVSLPTLRVNGGIPEVVLAPIHLLQQIAVAGVEAAVNLANAAAGSANTAAGKANTAATKADTATGNATTAANSVNTAIALALAATNGANQAAALALARLQELDGFTELVAQDLSLSPTRMDVTYTSKITLGNPYAQSIAAQLFPKYLPQNVLFLCAGGDSLSVDPASGKLTILKTGKSYFHVIPTGKTSLYQTIDIEVQAPVYRKTGAGGMRLTSSGAIRIT